MSEWVDAVLKGNHGVAKQIASRDGVSSCSCQKSLRRFETGCEESVGGLPGRVSSRALVLRG